MPDAVYVGLLWLAAVAAVAMSLGLLTRLATATTFVIVVYNLFLSTTHFHNNRAYLVIVLGVLAVAPCGRELSLDAWIRRRRGRPALDLSAPAWPLWLLRFECAAIYGASGLSKLLDPDWFGGTVTWQRVVRVRDELEASPLPEWALSVLTDRSFHTGAAKVIVLTELFIAVGLWWRGSRYLAVWVAVAFHVAIEISASVQVFSFLGIAVLVIWAVPSTRDRVIRIDPTAARHRRWAARGPRARLAGPISRRAGPARFPARGRGPGRHHAPRRAGPRARVQPPAADGVVRAADAAPARRPPGPRTMIATRVWRAGLTLALIVAFAFVVVAPPERCPSVTAAELRGSAQASVDWFVRNQDSDGTWLYLYDAERDSTPSDYNEVRHAGVTMGLYQAAAAGLPGASRSADRGTEWALDRLLERDGWAALARRRRGQHGRNRTPGRRADHSPGGHR